MAIAVAVSAFVALVSLVLSLLIFRELRTLTSVFRKGHGEPCPTGAAVSQPPAPVGADEPDPALALARSASQGRTAALPPPRSGRRLTPEPDEQGPVTRPSTAPGDAVAARTKSSRPPPPVEVVVQRDATLPPPRDDDEGDRDTGEGRTKVWSARKIMALVKRPAPHKRPVPIKSDRPTLLGGAPPVLRIDDPDRVVLPGNRTRAEHIVARFGDLYTAHGTEHCHGPTCSPQNGLCRCPCSPCEQRRALFARAIRENAEAEALYLETHKVGSDDDAIQAAYEAMCERARAAGLAVGHCDNGEAGCEVGGSCPTPAGIPSAEWHAVGRVDLCRCNCEGCRRACACWLQAQREVMGPRRS